MSNGGNPRGVVIVYNEPRPDGPWRESDAGVLGEVQTIADALRRLGIRHRREAIRRLSDLPTVLLAADEPVVFNLVEAFWQGQGDGDDPRDLALVPAVCRAMSKACTGSDSCCLSLCLDKWQTKAALEAYGVPTPPGIVVAPACQGDAAASLAAGPPGAEQGGGCLPAGLLPPGSLIVKPLMADGSEGITAASVVPGDGPALRQAIAAVHRDLAQPALIEQFIDGRELNVSVLERDGRPEVLPLGEIDFSAFAPGMPRIVDYAAKWLEASFEFRHTPHIVPAPLPAEQAREVRRIALAAWNAVGAAGYARVDFRLDASGRPLVLEVNPNPDISPDAGLAAALAAAGIEFHQFVLMAIQAAMARCEPRAGGWRPGATHGGCQTAARDAETPVTDQTDAGATRDQTGDRHGLEGSAEPVPMPKTGDRHGLEDSAEPVPMPKGDWLAPQGRACPQGPQMGAVGVLIRRTEVGDRQAILDAVVRTGFFRPDETAVAREVLDAAIDAGPQGDYQSYTAELPAAARLSSTPSARTDRSSPMSGGQGARVAGWVCFGPIACTLGSYDVYWVVVDREFQGRGIGKALMQFAEDDIRRRGGRIAVAETSSRPVYKPTRAFYLKLGYVQEALLRDFYAPGDDKIVYTKRLAV